jgi:hypothetical protein
MTFVPLTPEEVAAKAPVDDELMGKIKSDLDDLNSRVIAAGAAPFVYEVQGKISSKLANYRRSIAMGVLNKEFIPTLCRFMLKQSGTTDLAFDIRKHTSPKTPIVGIDNQYSATTSSISRQGSSLSTQSITRATAQISTQSITFAKAQANILSIISLGSLTIGGVPYANCFQYNLDVAPDADCIVGDSFLVASATASGNNGTFASIDINRGGGANFVVSNASGAAQAGAVGNTQVQIMSYNFTNPVNALFQVSFSAHFNGHTNALNDGDYFIYSINQGGNSIWVKNSSGVTQGTAAGTADSNLFKFNMASLVSTTDYVVGELALTQSHTDTNNNGLMSIRALNVGGNNVVLHVFQGATQGGAVGTVDTTRWAYNMPTDPTSDINVGDTVVALGHTSSVNDSQSGLPFVVKGLTSSLIIVSNVIGAVQVSGGGTISTTRKLVKFSSDQSAVYTTDSYIEMAEVADDSYNDHFYLAPAKVLQINRGGGANHNIVIDSVLGGAVGASGYVQTEMKSIFSILPILAKSLTGQEPNQNIVGSSTDFVNTVIPENTPVMLYITSLPFGDARDLSVILT